VRHLTHGLQYGRNSKLVRIGFLKILKNENKKKSSDKLEKPSDKTGKLTGYHFHSKYEFEIKTG
jgi:hypothetical protein